MADLFADSSVASSSTASIASTASTVSNGVSTSNDDVTSNAASNAVERSSDLLGPASTINQGHPAPTMVAYNPHTPVLMATVTTTATSNASSHTNDDETSSNRPTGSTTTTCTGPTNQLGPARQHLSRACARPLPTQWVPQPKDFFDSSSEEESVYTEPDESYNTCDISVDTECCGPMRESMGIGMDMSMDASDDEPEFSVASSRNSAMSVSRPPTSPPVSVSGNQPQPPIEHPGDPRLHPEVPRIVITPTRAPFFDEEDPNFNPHTASHLDLKDAYFRLLASNMAMEEIMKSYESRITELEYGLFTRMNYVVNGTQGLIRAEVQATTSNMILRQDIADNTEDVSQLTSEVHRLGLKINKIYRAFDDLLDLDRMQ